MRWNRSTHYTTPSKITSTLLAGALYLTLSLAQDIVHAQESARALTPRANPNSINTAGTNSTTGNNTADIAAEVLRGRTLLEVNDPNAVAVLRDASQRALMALFVVTGPTIITSPPTPDQTPTDQFTIGLIRQAAVAHYYWGIAADHFGYRDATVTALARASRLAQVIRYYDNVLARDTANELTNGNLKFGLPLYAPDDTIDIIASSLGNLWTPRRFRFDYSGLVFEPGRTSQSNTSQTAEFLITSGKLFPPPAAGTIDPNKSLFRIPPLYRKVPPGNLPPVLRLNQMIVGFERETTGPNRGLWHQVVQVFFASPVLTRDRRDDRPRAEALCVQFLKLRALARAGFNLELDNRYTLNYSEKTRQSTRDGITTLWLSEVSAWWPLDDDDPAVQDALGTRMPPPNTPVVMDGKKVLQNDVKWSPLSYPWRYTLPDLDIANTVGVIARAPGVTQAGSTTANGTTPGTVSPGIVPTSNGAANGTPNGGSPYAAPNSGAGAGQIDSDWGEIMFFKMSQPRDETEWLRELVHEYGHVTLPPFTGFQPPLEPYGNGLVGETIGMLWAAAIPHTFAVQPTAATGISTVAQNNGARDPALTQGLYDHVARNAIPALKFWNTQGPSSKLLSDGNPDGLQYLQGLAVHLERVYGARVLSEALKPLAKLSEPTALDPTRPTFTPEATLNATDLLGSASKVLRTSLTGDQKQLPIWLPGALELPAARHTPADFAARAPLQLNAGERIPCWLFIPAGTGTLHIEWKTPPGATKNNTTLQVEGGWKSNTKTSATPGTKHTEVEINTRQGWQRFAFVPSDVLTISNAWFERVPSSATRSLATADAAAIID